MVVNLTAFEVFFPERRVFFQEGQDILIQALELLADEVSAL